MILAITGGTGFVGGRLIDRAIADGHRVRALTRRPQPDRPGVTWIAGALDDPPALARLVDGVDAVVHVAGVTSARDLAAFRAGNVAGTEAVIAAAGSAAIGRFVHVSSLAARAPELSRYGTSKAEAEALVAASGLDWAMVRPPAIYGSSEFVDLFRMATRGFVLLPPGGRLAVIGGDDLARLLLALAAPGAPSRVIFEADDGREHGWDQRELARAIGTAVGRAIVPLPIPRPLLTIAAHGDRLVRGARAQLTPDRVRYFCHPDWSVDPRRRPLPGLWQPLTPTAQGLADAAAWYRAQGLL